MILILIIILIIIIIIMMQHGSACFPHQGHPGWVVLFLRLNHGTILSAAELLPVMASTVFPWVSAKLV